MLPCSVVLLFCWYIGKSEADVQTQKLNIPSYDVNDVIGTRCCPADDCYPSQSEVASFNNKLKGRVILPHMYEYVNQSQMYNTYEQRYPRIVVMVHSKEDIKETIMFSRKYNLHVTIRSSGHDYVGRSTWDGSINVNLSEMKEYEVKLDSSRNEHGEIKVQTGLTWAEIYKMLDQIYNRTIVGGSDHKVTPGGYTLGGGHSPISRSLGYAVDNVLEIQAVLADSRIATCTESSCLIQELDGSDTTHSGDLFWAMRGGGGGTFGVVVYFVFKLHPMPAGMVTVKTRMPLKIDGGDVSGELLSALANLIISMPKEWGGYYILSNSKTNYQGTEITGSLKLSMNKFGPWDGTEEKVFEQFIYIGKRLQINVTFTNISSFWEYEKNITSPPLTRIYIVGTLLQPENVNEDLVTFIQQELFTNFRDIRFGCIGTLLGGKTTEFPLDSTPLNPGYRTAVSCLTCYVVLASATRQTWFEQSQNDDILIPLADAFSKRLSGFGTGMYVNEPTKNNPRWREDFWGYHYTRLLEIKRHYDPENVFTCHHCVGSEFMSKSTIPETPSAAAKNARVILTVMFVISKLLDNWLR